MQQERNERRAGGGIATRMGMISEEGVLQRERDELEGNGVLQHERDESKEGVLQQEEKPEEGVLQRERDEC